MNPRRELYRFSFWLERKLAPRLEYSQAEYESELRTRVPTAKSWLDLGCGHAVLPAWREQAERELVDSCPFVVGIDYDVQALQAHRSLSFKCRAEIGSLPFADESFDIVTANMVVEHLANPVEQVREVWRVLRPSGQFVIHTPHVWGHPTILARALPHAVKRRAAAWLDDREAEDVYPTYYRANSAAALRAIATDAGFEIGALRYITGAPLFRVVPPLLLPELLWMRAISQPALAGLRSNLLGVLVRPS